MSDIFDRWPSFSPAELLSPDGMIDLRTKNVFRLRVEAVDFLQDFRDKIGKPLHCNTHTMKLRAYRSPHENARVQMGVGKSPWQQSFHVQGIAFDLHSSGMTIQELHQAAKEFGWKGIGKYPTFIHVDLRDGAPARWIIGA